MSICNYYLYRFISIFSFSPFPLAWYHSSNFTGLPDPPVDIQVESGPQEGTLLVTWLPITLNQFGTSNNCPVTGYAVFAGHKKLAEIDSPTGLRYFIMFKYLLQYNYFFCCKGDHALLSIGSLEYLHKKQVTVRTKSGENLSQDSMPCQIPDDLLKLPSTLNPNIVTKRVSISLFNFIQSIVD